MKSNKYPSKLILVPTLLIFVISILFLALAGFDYGNLSNFVTSYGVWGAIVYILMGALSIVVAPTSVIPLWPAVFGAYGFWGAVSLTWISGRIGAAPNFYIARKAISLTLIPSIAVMVGMYFLAVFVGIKVWRRYMNVEKKSRKE